VYDVVFRDSASHLTIIAAGLGRESAVSIARSEARRRQAGRMFLAGSGYVPRGEMVLIVEAARNAA
jgi:hypothetical protein